MFSETEHEVTIAMTRDDYNLLMIALGTAIGVAISDQGLLRTDVLLGLVDRLNEGNPRYRPYEIHE